MSMQQSQGTLESRPAVSNRSIAQCGVMVALIAVAAQVTVAVGPVPFTLQLLVIALAALVFSPAQAALALFVYVLVGLVGFPVFSGMSGGLGKILGVTGGYIYGFIPAVFLGSLVRRLVGGPSCPEGLVRRTVADALACLATVAVCYALGTLHFMAVTALAGSAVDMAYVLGVCVVPFIVPDVLKCVAAVLVANVLRRALPSLREN